MNCCAHVFRCWANHKHGWPGPSCTFLSGEAIVVIWRRITTARGQTVSQLVELWLSGLLQLKGPKKGQVVGSNSNVLVLFKQSISIQPFYCWFQCFYSTGLPSEGSQQKCCNIEIEGWSEPPFYKMTFLCLLLLEILAANIMPAQYAVQALSVYFHCPCQASQELWLEANGCLGLPPCRDNDQNEPNHCNQRMMTSPPPLVG